MIDLQEHINFNDQTWINLKLWLEETQKNKIGLLIAETDHDQSNKLRGALSIIRELLHSEIAAKMAANQRI